MKSLRRALFWTHLVLGLLAGGVIAVTVFTGACLAFEKQVLDWAERDLRRVALPNPDAPRLELEALLAKAREASPGAPLASITVRSDPQAAVMLTFGRSNLVYANPYTGELRSQTPGALREFFQRMLRWHRWLGVSQAVPGGPGAGREAGERAAVGPGSGEGAPREAGETGGEGPRREGPGGPRAIAGTVVGISACLFGTLCLSGLYLWWPRSWRWHVVRAVLLPNLRLRGKSRDWNWHNAIGFWSAPALLVMSLTGVVMAFRPVGNVIYGAATPGQGPGGGGSGTNQPAFTPPEPGVRPLSPERLITLAAREVPDWREITVRAGGRQRGRRGGGGEGERPAAGDRMDRRESGESPQRREGEGGMEGGAPALREGRGGRGMPAASVMVRRAGGGWIPPVQLQLHPFTGEVLRHTSFGRQVDEVGLRRALRGMNRTVHTGEAGGLPGQLMGFLACLGGLFLVYTGFALSWRRFLTRRPTQSTAASVALPAPAVEASASEGTPAGTAGQPVLGAPFLPVDREGRPVSARCPIASAHR